MAREGLRIPLRTALHKAIKARERVIQRQISVQTNGTVSQVDLIVEPIAEFRSSNLYMIVFEDSASSATLPQGPASLPDASAEETIRHLEDELRSAREHAQSVYEELETSNEELKSANEEFQSTNEELETSKEELQSFNEELQTVNAEVSRKVTELDHANSDLQNFLNSTQIATIFLNQELRIRNFTPAAGTVFRLIASDVGRPITDLAAQFAAGDLVSDIQEVLRTLIPTERQLAGLEGRHYQMRVLPYRSVQNVIEGVVVTFTDVTEAKRAQLLIEEARVFAENIVETVREPLLVLDDSARVKSANQAFYETFHVSSKETLNTILFELGNGQWDIPELRRLLGELLPQKKTIEDFEVRHDFPTIGHRTMLLNARQILPRERHEPLILLAIEDVTRHRLAEEALRQSEERYSSLFHSCPVAVYSCDAAGVIVDFNARAAELWGREPKPGDTDERFCGSYKMHLPDGTFLPHDQCPMAEVLAGTIPEARDMEVQIERPDGTWITVIVNIRLLRSDRGEITGAINCFFDVTERAQMQAELRALNTDLQHFSYAASHDLQEPLRMVMSYTQVLASEYEGRLDPQADRYIGYAVDGAQRMEALLRDLREYWSVNERRVEKRVAVDCNRALAEAIDNLELSIRESGAAITHDSLPVVMAEELPVILLFQNLVSNAIKYRRPEASPRIQISAVRSAASWKISVADNGIGIQAEHLQTIFGPFKRVYGREYPGTGLGLSICQKVVERYGGRIWVESTYGQGSIFHFKLPAEGGES